VSAVTLTFEDGTVRVGGPDDAVADLPGVEHDDRAGVNRIPAHRYAALQAALAERGVAVDDRVFDLPSLSLSTAYELREYQQAALDAWLATDEGGSGGDRHDAENGADAGRLPAPRGVIELPTGSGKTVIGIAAMAALDTPALVVAPTIDLVEQWRRELQREFDAAVGQLGGGEQRVEEVTVATYDSAYLRAAELGDRFGLVVFDEVHHLGGEGYRDVARLLAAPARLGLTATFERPDGAHEVVADLVGDRVYALDPDDLAGDYLARSNIRMDSGSDYQQLVKRSGTDPAAREALLAKQRAREVMMNSDAKVAELERLIDRHRDDRVIVFCAHNDMVYRLAERFLLPAITHQTSASERREILERFRDGTYSRVVAANVLDEGVDVPDANVAVVLAGSGSEREFTQRLGRILRPTADGGRALLYELVTAETAEERVADRRR
jgi:superfamily II DNA or RNA helicase